MVPCFGLTFCAVVGWWVYTVACCCLSVCLSVIRTGLPTYTIGYEFPQSAYVSVQQIDRLYLCLSGSLLTYLLRDLYLKKDPILPSVFSTRRASCLLDD